MNIWQPDVMVLGPGGARGFLLLGCLKRLFEEKGFMKRTKTWVGVSVGSAICLLLVAGYTIDEIIELCIDVNLIDDILCINLDCLLYTSPSPRDGLLSR